MIGVAQLIREHRTAAARTLRETFGVGLSDLGDALTWGEAKLLLEAAAGDGSTVLGAELADWAYTASMTELLTLIAQVGDPKVSNRLMPWSLESPRRKGNGTTATADEMAIAEAQLEADFVFTT